MSKSTPNDMSSIDCKILIKINGVFCLFEVHIKDAQGLLHFMIYNLCTLLSGTLGILYPVEL